MLKSNLARSGGEKEKKNEDAQWEKPTCLLIKWESRSGKERSELVRLVVLEDYQENEHPEEISMQFGEKTDQ